jgi:hypothetical protein
MFEIKKHRQVLFELVTAIYRSEISSFLGFKGGTMAYFFYGLNRFSIDLDFDLLSPDKKDLVHQELLAILKNFGVVKEVTDKRYTLFYLLNYKKGVKNIKIEISKRVNKLYRYKTVSFYGTDVKILDEEDAFTSKLLAATTRNRIAYRDFFDIYFYLKKGVDVNELLIKNITGKNLKSYLKYLIKFTKKNLSKRTVLHGLGELVDEKQKAWIKNHLKEELINRLTYLIGDRPQDRLGLT